jgi:HEAT repeat protein
MLGDEDAAVAQDALWELDDAGVLSGEELLPLLEVPTIAVGAISLLGTMKSEPTTSALLARARRGVEPDPLSALVGQVCRGGASEAQREEVLDMLLARFAEAAAPGLVKDLGVFVPGHPRALDALLAATRHEDGFVRYEVADVLAEVAGAEALEALDALSTDPLIPTDGDRCKPWDVGENARRAAVRIRAKVADVQGDPPG